jgi:hypothetical protein
MVQKHLEYQNTSFLNNGFQYVQDLMPIMSKPKPKYDPMLRPHTILARETPSNSYFRSCSSEIPFDLNYPLSDPFISYQNPSSLNQFALDFLFEQQQQQQQWRQMESPSLHEFVPMTNDQAWGIPSSYDPISSPRLLLSYQFPNLFTPHTTNQPFIYLPPVFSQPTPSFAKHPPDDLASDNPQKEPSSIFPKSLPHPRARESLPVGLPSLSATRLSAIDELHHSPRNSCRPSFLSPSQDLIPLDPHHDSDDHNFVCTVSDLPSQSNSEITPTHGNAHDFHSSQNKKRKLLSA